MKIAFVTAESLPFVKTGGLADVSFSLTQSLANKGHEVVLFMPKYTKIIHEVETEHEREFYVHNNYIGIDCCYVNKVKYVFIDNEYFFNRTYNSSYYYGHGDDGYRFSLFSRAILDYFGYADWFPELIHVNDWHTAILPYILNSEHRNNEKYQNIRTYLTIHNFEFQGWFDFDECDLKYDSSIMKNNKVNFLKAGINNVTKINTVSPSYRDSTLDSGFACGLDYELYLRRADYCGILNGIDYDFFDPEKDPHIYHTYDHLSVNRYKLENKLKFKKEFNLGNSERPLYCMITRLTMQKGVDLVLNRIEEILAEDLDLFVLGSGDYIFEEHLNNLAQKHKNLKIYIGYNEDLAHKLYAASDYLLMPSRFEPCGLSQMIAMRYGCIPIVYDIHGLHDSVQSYDEFNRHGTGLSFNNFDAYIFLNMIKYAQYLYTNHNHIYTLRNNAMKVDFSTKNMTESYELLYLDY